MLAGLHFISRYACVYYDNTTTDHTWTGMWKMMPVRGRGIPIRLMVFEAGQWFRFNSFYFFLQMPLYVN